MTAEEFDNTTDLASVRTIQRELMALDPRVGPYISEEEHATVRRLVRQWETKLLAAIAVRKAKAKNDTESLFKGV
jgi:hypothetical protein